MICLPSWQPSADCWCAQRTVVCALPTALCYRCLRHDAPPSATGRFQWQRLKLGIVCRQRQEPPTHYCSFGERWKHTSSDCRSDWSEAAVATHNLSTETCDIAPFIARSS